MRWCSNHKKALYRELYDVTVHGKVGNLEIAWGMPTEFRRFWFQQMAEDRKAEAEETERIRRRG